MAFAFAPQGVLTPNPSFLPHPWLESSLQEAKKGSKKREAGESCGEAIILLRLGTNSNVSADDDDDTTYPPPTEPSFLPWELR